MVIAGAALIKGAKVKTSQAWILAGQRSRNHSGCADVRVPNDQVAIDLIREDVAALQHGYRVLSARCRRDGAELLGQEIAEIFPTDFRQIYDIEQVIARLVDQSLFRGCCRATVARW